MDVDDIVAANRIDLIDKEDIVDAVDAALEFTYSKSPLLIVLLALQLIL